MKMSFRRVSTLMTGTAFVMFAFLAPNCTPSAGNFSGNGGGSGSGDGGNSGNGGNTGNGGTTSSNGGTTSSNGGSSSNGGTTSSNGGTTSKGGTTGNGGSSSSGGTTTSNGGTTTSNGGTTTSNGGTTTSNGGTTTTPSAGGSGGGSTGARQCSPTTATTPAVTSTGGLACPGGLCTVGTYSGYLYVYADGAPSKVCAATDSLCASGSTGVADAKGTIWGAGVGFNLDKSATPAAVQLSGTGMTYALSAMPSQGMRAQVSVAGTDYCVKLATASGTVAWTDFNTACWDNSGTKLAGAPLTPHVGFQVTAAATAGTFDFCVTAVSFQ
jgi:hypothetical protein